MGLVLTIAAFAQVDYTRFEKTSAASDGHLRSYLAPASADKNFSASDSAFNHGLLKAAEQSLALLKHNVDLVSEVVVLHSSLRVSVNLEVAVSNCHSCASVLCYSRSLNDVDFAELLLFHDESCVYLAKKLV